MSGYTHCSCHDCMDVCMTADLGGWTLCLLCLDAGCTPSTPARMDGGYTECQREDAYGVEL